MSDQVIYTVGGTVQAGDGIYISREADEELLRLCRAGEFCYVLTARQMGKSSLMVATRERLAAEDIRSVEIDLNQMGSELSGLTAEQWYLGLVHLIVDQLDLDVDYRAWWDGRAHLGPTQRLSQFLRQGVLERVSDPVVIFVDEIDSTLSLDFTDDFFAAIRACHNARASDPAFKRLSFVLLGVATPDDLISDPQRTPFNIGQRIDLTDFTHRETIPLAFGLDLPPVEAGQVLIWILDWTGGHPYLTQRLCAAAAASPTKNWDAAAVDELVEEAFLGEQSAQDSNLRFVWDMLTQRAPDRAVVLKTYRRIHAGKAVPDEERSLVKTHLKLSGIVKRKASNLVIRNRIYEQVFNQEWISQNMPRDWAQRIAVISTILALVLGGLFGYYTYRQGQQTAEARAQAFIDSFHGTTSADVRITSLAGLFELSGYEDRARQLFYEGLSPEEQRALFERADPQAVGTQLVTVVKGLYTELENNDRDNQLLEVMAQPLRELDDPVAVNLTSEIEQWTQGREACAEGKYEQAVIAYSVAISLNDANPATRFDRAIAYAGLGRYQEALAEFEETLQLDKERALIIDKEIRSNGALYGTLNANRVQYPELSAVVPTPTPTNTPTITPTPTNTLTITPTPTNTPTAILPTRAPSPIPIASPTPTSSFTPSPTAILPLRTPVDVEVWDVDINPRNSKIIYVVAKGKGIYRAVDGGYRWEQILASGNIISLTIDPVNPSTLYAATVDTVLRSTDDGTTWELVTGRDELPSAVYGLAVVPDNDQIIYAATDGGVYRSSDGGRTWEPRNKAMGNTPIYSLAFGSSDGLLVYAAGKGAEVWKSTDGGSAPWERLSSDYLKEEIHALALHPHNSQWIYAGADDSILLLSTDGGHNWVLRNGGLKHPGIVLQVSALAIDPRNPNIIYAGTGFRSNYDGHGIYKSTNGGLSWKPINNGLPVDQMWLGGYYVQAIAIDPYDSQTIYVGGFSGLYKSTDGGMSWQQ